MADTDTGRNLEIKADPYGGPMSDANTQARIKRLEGAEASGISALSGVTSDTMGKVRGLESRIDALHMPELKQVPPPQPKMTDPLQIWGSMAMILAAVGSLKTRQPLTTAMNAAAAVMQGYKKGDLEAANAAYQTWKVSNENAKTIFQSQMDAYKTILSGYERREGLAIQEGGMRERTIAAQLAATARAFGDENTALIADQGHIDRVQNHIDRMKDLAAKGADSEVGIERKKTQNDALHKLKNDPEFNALDPMDKLKKIAEIQGAGSPAAQAHKDAMEKREQAAETKKKDADYRLTEINRKIDEVVSDFDKMGADPTGITGMVARPLESVQNKLGISDSTAYNSFNNKVQTIRALVTPLVAGGAYRSNPTLRAQIDAIVPGLERGATSQNTIAALLSLKEMLPRLRGEFGLDESKPEVGDGSKNRPMKINSQDEYNEAPSGAWVIDSSGKLGRKP